MTRTMPGQPLLRRDRMPKAPPGAGAGRTGHRRRRFDQQVISVVKLRVEPGRQSGTWRRLVPGWENWPELEAKVAGSRESQVGTACRNEHLKAEMQDLKDTHGQIRSGRRGDLSAVRAVAQPRTPPSTLEQLKWRGLPRVTRIGYNQAELNDLSKKLEDGVDKLNSRGLTGCGETCSFRSCRSID